MATVVNFHGKKYIEPGAYAVSVYNPTSTVNVAEFGNVMIIDTGLSKANTGQEFSGGSGINGELNQGLKSVYAFESYEDFRAFVGGGLIGDVARKIFEPRSGVLGAPKLYYTRAAVTDAAKISLELKAAVVEPAAAAVVLTLTCKNEGTVGNALWYQDQSSSASNLRAGYAAEIVSGTDNASAFKLNVYKGTYMGVDKDGECYGTCWDDSRPELIVESDEFTNISDLIDWVKGDKMTNSYFKVTVTGTYTTSDALSLISLTGATGGGTYYDGDTRGGITVSGNYDAVLEAIEELDITFFLCDTDVTNGTNDATNGKLFTFLKNNAKFTEFMVVPGGVGEDDLLNTTTVTAGTSEAIAKRFDSEQAVVIHGSPIEARKDGTGTKELPSIYLAASIIGMAAGAAPQTPLTFKRTGYDNFKYDLKRKQREKALQAGIMHVRNVNGYWVVNQGITTVQDNKQTYAADGQTCELSIALVKAQVNKELIIDASNRFVGGNVGTVSPATVKNFVETKLQSMTVVGTEDNLIIKWQNVVVKSKNTDFFCSYDFIPNIPLNKLFFTGNVLDFSV